VGSSLTLVIAVLVCQGVGFAFFSSPNMTTIMNSVPSTLVGGASALGAASRSMGMIIGMLAASVLLTLYVGDVALAAAPERFLLAMGVAYRILAVGAGLALLLSLRALLRRAGARRRADAVDGGDGEDGGDERPEGGGPAESG
jgi:MFS family permease